LDRPERERLSEEEFIRHRLFGGGKVSPLRRYAELVLAHPTTLSLLRYEILTTLLSPIPGALGLALRGAFWRFLFRDPGKGVLFGCRVTIRHPERIRLGRGVVIDDDALLDGRGAGDEGLVLGDRVIVNKGATIQAKVGGITIGEGSNVGQGVKIVSQGPIRIAENVSLAGGSVVAGGRYVVERTGDPKDDKQRFTGGEIRIEKNVRIGMNAIVQDGVTIGEAAIVAPGSVVVSDVEAHIVVSGFPARPWRERKVHDDAAAPADAVPRAAAPPAAAPATPAAAASAPAATSSSPTPSAPATPGAETDVAARVRAYLEEVRFADFDDGTLSETDSLFDKDILDSLSLVALVAWLEKTFAVEISDEDLVPENLESVRQIARFVAARTSEGRLP
jgi:acetyltransferase-like isoleucine patch superfamily enzyme/acyl carrier protein